VLELSLHGLWSLHLNSKISSYYRILPSSFKKQKDLIDMFMLKKMTVSSLVNHA